MFKIAIDGPAGAGKSTISKIVAEKLHFEYIDTGAMYRAVTLKALRLGIDMEDENAYGFLDSTSLDIMNGHVILDGEDVTEAIRSVEVTNQVSTPSKIGVVRSFLVDYQRKISDAKNVIMDGRDIGTVVLPNADLKIYLDATVECRAKRRMLERLEKGLSLSLEETIKEIEVRDFKDSTRKISPLKKADDAIVIDSSNMTIDEVVNEIILLVNERGFKTMSKERITEFQTVKGRIINVTKDAIYLELEEGEKAVIYSNDLLNYSEGQKLRDSYNEGQEFEAQVKQIAKDRKTGEPLYILSTKLEAEKEKLSIFEELKEKDEIISAKIVKVTNAGADLVYHDLKVFMPIRNVDLSVEALHKMVGQHLDVIVTFVNKDRMQVQVSNHLALKKQARLQKEEALSKIHEGDILEGVVVDVLPYGAIVSLGQVSGLLHVSEISHKLVRNANDVYKVNDKVTVKVIKMEKDRIGLSVRQLTPHPWEILKEKYHEGDVFEGVVAKVIDAGLLIKLTDEYSGLMPKSEYSWLVNEKLDGKYNEGDKITVKVLSIDDAKKRVSLSHRATVENTWGSIKVRKGDTIKVSIAEIVERGAKVNYLNVTGFMPINEVTATRRIQKVDEVFPVGTEVEVCVIDVDPSRAKLVVSAKALELAKERAEYDKYYKEQEKETPAATLGELIGKMNLFDEEEDK
ncbi:MAG: (d)CMP kinase [Bacilli bacterium]